MIKFIDNCFILENKFHSYIMQVLDNEEIGQLYFGSPIEFESNDLYYELKRSVMSVESRDTETFSLSYIKREFPTSGRSDFDVSMLELDDGNAYKVLGLKYKDYAIINEENKFDGLPFADKNNAETLVIYLENSYISVELFYTIYADVSGIVRKVKVNNKSEDSISLKRIMSYNLDLEYSNYKLQTFNGTWINERKSVVSDITEGIKTIESRCGASSSQHNPYIMVFDNDTTYENGSAYSFNLLYSGNFKQEVQLNTFGRIRITGGINDFHFTWKLEQNESFTTPEALIQVSDKGIGELVRRNHTFINEKIVSKAFAKKPSPIAINNWEATYFDFDNEKLYSLAKQAKEVGIELFVLDDGWYGQRNDDTTSLGDWDIYNKKLTVTVPELAKKIVEELDIQFGLWFEPEMVSVDSKLYVENPDYAIGNYTDEKCFGRNQLVLDFTNEKVVEEIFIKMCLTLDCGYISYVKWDMNRYITDVFGMNNPAFYHKYIIGVYSLYDKLKTKFPQIRFESCASGGSRYDLGMLWCAPQAWISDNTDANERVRIQYDTAYGYPISTFGTHVSDVPNHQTNRITSLATRTNVAFYGTFGYELDITKMDDNSLNKIKEDIELFKSMREKIITSNFYHLSFESNLNPYTSWATFDGKEGSIFIYLKHLTPNMKVYHLKMNFVDINKKYSINGKIYDGIYLKNTGLRLDKIFTGNNVGYIPENANSNDNLGLHDFSSAIYEIKVV